MDALSVPKVKTTSHGIKFINLLGPKIWNSLPNEIKSSKNASQLKVLIKIGISKINAPVTLAVNDFHNAISIIASC